MGKEIVNQVQEAQKIPWRINPRRNMPRHILIKLSKIKYKERILGDFPGGTVVKNTSANAGDMGSSPRLGRSHMPQSNGVHVPQLLSLHSRSHKPQLLSP